MRGDSPLSLTRVSFQSASHALTSYAPMRRYALIPTALLNQNWGVSKALLTDYVEAAGGSKADLAGAVGKLGMFMGLSFMAGPLLATLLVKSYTQALTLSTVIAGASALLLLMLPTPRRKAAKAADGAIDEVELTPATPVAGAGSATEAPPPADFAPAPTPPAVAPASWRAQLVAFIEMPALRSRGAQLLIALRLFMALAFHLYAPIWQVSIKKRFDFTPADHAQFMGLIGLTCAAHSRPHAFPPPPTSPFHRRPQAPSTAAHKPLPPPPARLSDAARTPLPPPPSRRCRLAAATADSAGRHGLAQPRLLLAPRRTCGSCARPRRPLHDRRLASPPRLRYALSQGAVAKPLIRFFGADRSSKLLLLCIAVLGGFRPVALHTPHLSVVYCLCAAVAPPRPAAAHPAPRPTLPRPPRTASPHSHCLARLAQPRPSSTASRLWPWTTAWYACAAPLLRP